MLEQFLFPQIAIVCKQDDKLFKQHISKLLDKRLDNVAVSWPPKNAFLDLQKKHRLC